MTRAKMIVKALEKADENEKMGIIGVLYCKGISDGAELALDMGLNDEAELSEEICQQRADIYFKTKISDTPSREFDKLLLSIANR